MNSGMQLAAVITSVFHAKPNVNRKEVSEIKEWKKVIA